MLSVPLKMDDLLPILPEDISLAVDNGPSCIVAGNVMTIKNLRKN